MKLRHCLIILVLFKQTFAQKIQEPISSHKLRKPAGEPITTMMSINNISMWVQEDRKLTRHPDGQWSVIYPKGTAGVVYHDGIVWGGMVGDGRMQLIRVGGSIYESGLQQGRIISKGIAEDPDNPDVRTWRIRRDWKMADLKRDAAEYLSVSEDSVTQADIDSLRSQYEKDWNEWPWEKGAPFYDTNGNGIMDDVEEPGLAYADQVVWYVANDLDRDKILNFMGSFPIGLEIQVTVWAYNRTEPDNPVYLNDVLQNIIFKRVRLIYKGHENTPDGARIDNMYIGQWSNPNLGDYDDDLVGCDTLLDMGFVYNGMQIDNRYAEFGIPPAAFGYAMVIGPMVFSTADQAFFNLKLKKGYMNLPMTSFTWFATGSAVSEPRSNYGYEGVLEFYTLLQGYYPLCSCSEFFPFPPGMKPDHFPFSGDPVQGTGYLDGQGELWSFPPSDRRFMINSGPFTMALGDTQEVVIALVGGLGADRLSSISLMKYHTKWARQLAQSNFNIGFKKKVELLNVEKELPSDFMLYPNTPNPFNAGTEILYNLPLEKNVRLVIYNVLGQKVKVLVDEIQEADKYSYRWDGTNDYGEKVPSGVYLCRLEAGYWVLTRKMTLLE